MEYKGFLIQPLVFLHPSDGKRCRERQYDVAVRVRVDDGADTGEVFHLPSLHSFEFLGEARRAGEAFAQRIIDGNVPGVKLTPPSMRPQPPKPEPVAEVVPVPKAPAKKTRAKKVAAEPAETKTAA